MILFKLKNLKVNSCKLYIRVKFNGISYLNLEDMNYFKIKIKLIETNDDQYIFSFNIHVKIL